MDSFRDRFGLFRDYYVGYFVGILYMLYLALRIKGVIT